MLLLFLIFAQTSAVNMLLVSRIKDCVHSHAYLPDVDAMCHVVLERLKHKGIFFDSPSLCTNATIQSEYGTTLSEVYAQYERFDTNKLKTHFASIRSFKCTTECQYTLLFDSSIERWVDKHAPIPIPDDCYPNPVRYHNSVLEVCVPFKNITVGDFKLNRESFDNCLQCLQHYDQLIEDYNKFRTEFIQFPATLTREIAQVWRHQMPEALANVASDAIIKYS
jgi:hypothetical protein